MEYDMPDADEALETSMVWPFACKRLIEVDGPPGQRTREWRVRSREWSVQRGVQEALYLFSSASGRRDSYKLKAAIDAKCGGRVASPSVIITDGSRGNPHECERAVPPNPPNAAARPCCRAGAAALFDARLPSRTLRGPSAPAAPARSLPAISTPVIANVHENVAVTVDVTGVELADLAEMVGTTVVAGFANRQELYFGRVDSFDAYGGVANVLFTDGDWVSYNVHAFRRREVRVVDEGSADEVAAAARASALLEGCGARGSRDRPRLRQTPTNSLNGGARVRADAGIARIRRHLVKSAEVDNAVSEWEESDDEGDAKEECGAREEREFALFFDGAPPQEIFSHLDEGTESWSDVVGENVPRRAVRSPQTALGQLRALCNDVGRRFQSTKPRGRESTKQVHMKARALGASTLDGLQGFAVFLNDKSMEEFLMLVCSIAKGESTAPFESLGAELCKEALDFVADEFGGDSRTAADAAGVGGAKALAAVAPAIVEAAHDRLGTPTVNAGHHVREFAPQCIFTIADAGSSGRDVGTVVEATDKGVLKALKQQGVRLVQALVPQLLEPTLQPALKSYLTGAFEKSAKVNMCLVGHRRALPRFFSVLFAFAALLCRFPRCPCWADWALLP